MDPWQLDEITRRLARRDASIQIDRVGSNQEAMMDDTKRRELINEARSIRTELEKAGTNPPAEDLAQLVRRLTVLIEGAIAFTDHAQAVDRELRKDEHPPTLGTAKRSEPGPAVGEAPKAGQEGTAGAKQGGPGWPEVERQGSDKFTVEPDPRD